jgi:hypothetical protein
MGAEAAGRDRALSGYRRPRSTRSAGRSGSIRSGSRRTRARPRRSPRLTEWTRDGITSTPTVLIGGTGGGRYTPIALRSLSADGTIPAVEQALAAAR